MHRDVTGNPEGKTGVHEGMGKRVEWWKKKGVIKSYYELSVKVSIAEI